MALFVPTAGWVLEACSCDPHVQHCPTCDERREIMHTITTLRDIVRDLGALAERIRLAQ